MRLPLLMPAAAKLERAGDPQNAGVEADDLVAAVEYAAVARPRTTKRDRLDLTHWCNTITGCHHICPGNLCPAERRRFVEKRSTSPQLGWGQWFGEVGSAVVDGAAAMGTAKTVGPGGSVSDGGSRGLTGYSIVSADSLDSAVELAKGCPVLEIGGAVDVYEAIAM